jgi:multidrug efflux pump
VRVQDIDNALNNAFSQRQISYIYTQRNQYVVVLETDPKFQSDPSNLERIFVAGANGAQVPLSTVVRYERGLSALAVFHSQSVPSTTVSFNLVPDVPRRQISSVRWRNCICQRAFVAVLTATPVTWQIKPPAGNC